MQDMGKSAEELAAAFGVRLKSLMDAKRLEISDLQKAAGVTYEMARRYYNGLAMPRTAKIKTIANLVGTTESYLTFGIIEEDDKAHHAKERESAYHTQTPPELVPLFEDLKRAYYNKSLPLEAISSFRSLANLLNAQGKDIGTNAEADSLHLGLGAKRLAKSERLIHPDSVPGADKNDELDAD